DLADALERHAIHLQRGSRLKDAIPVMEECLILRQAVASDGSKIQMLHLAHALTTFASISFNSGSSTIATTTITEAISIYRTFMDDDQLHMAAKERLVVALELYVKIESSEYDWEHTMMAAQLSKEATDIYRDLSCQNSRFRLDLAKSLCTSARL